MSAAIGAGETDSVAIQPDKSAPQLHTEAAFNALANCGLTKTVEVRGDSGAQRDHIVGGASTPRSFSEPAHGCSREMAIEALDPVLRKQMVAEFGAKRSSGRVSGASIH